MIRASFEKERSVYLLDCFHNGSDITRPPSGWTDDELLILAGAAHYFVCLRQRPQTPSGELMMPPRDLSNKWAKLEAHQSYVDASAANLWNACLTEFVYHGQYDAHFEAQVMVAIDTREAMMMVIPIQGFRTPSAE